MERIGFVSVPVAISAIGLLLIAAPTPATASDDYKVTVTRTDQDLYEVQGGKNFIKTRYCYEYATWDDAILRIDSPFGYSAGKIIFQNGASCDVAMVLTRTM